MNDPYETGTPKYKTAQCIYEALCELTQTEEMSILSEMFPDVSYDNQSYYYTDKGYTLKEKFEEMTEYGGKLWIVDLTINKIDQDEIHDVVYEALSNSDLAKRLGFKKIFIDTMLYGNKKDYEEISEDFLIELQDLNYFQYYEMIKAYNRVMSARGVEVYDNKYDDLCWALRTKLENLNLQKESLLVVECRALLTAYDDFILGLRMNQELYKTQERLYSSKVKYLQECYENQVKQLLFIAESNGICLEVGNVKLLNEISKGECDECDQAIWDEEEAE